MSRRGLWAASFAWSLVSGCVDLMVPAGDAAREVDAASPPARVDADVPAPVPDVGPALDAPADIKPASEPTPDVAAPAAVDAALMKPDAAVADSAPPRCKPFWEASYDGVPTTADLNGDGQPDFHVRDDRAFPASSVKNGVWEAPAGLVLDTFPLHPFDGRTIIDTHFQSVGAPSGMFGAVVWINVGQGGKSFAAFFASLVQAGNGTQTLTLYGKSSQSTIVALGSVGKLPDRLIALHLELDNVAGKFSALVDGQTPITGSFPRTGTPTGDRFAVQLAWEGSGGARFDDFVVQSCP